jgi:hypothetical protein
LLQLRLRREAIRTPPGGAVAGGQAAPTIPANRATVADNVLATGTVTSVRTETTIGTAMVEGTAPVAAAALAAGMEMAVGTAVRGSNLAGFLPVASDLAPVVDVPPAGGKCV